MKMKWVGALTAKLVHWRCHSMDLICFSSFIHTCTHTRGCKHTQWHAHTFAHVHAHWHRCTHAHTDTQYQQTLLTGLFESSRQARCGVQRLVGSATLKQRERKQDWAEGVEPAVALTQPTLQTNRQHREPQSPGAALLQPDTLSRPPGPQVRRQLLPWRGIWGTSRCHRDNRQISGSDREITER